METIIRTETGLRLATIGRVQRLKITAALLVCSMALSHTAKADEPVTIGLGGWLAITAGGAAITWAVNRLLDGPQAKVQPKQKATRTRVVTICKPDGTIVMKTEVLTIDPPLNDAFPIAQSTLPLDWSPQPTLAGDVTAGVFTARVDSPNGRLLQDANIDVQVGTNSFDVMSAEGAVGITDMWETTISVNGYFSRPASAGARDATLSFLPTGIVKLTTTDLPDSFATVGYKYVVSADQLGGVIFEGGVEIDQGSMSFRLINGGIPGANYVVTAPGILELTFANAPIVFAVPNSVDFIDFAVDTAFTGFARAGAHVPEPATLALVITSFLGIAITRRRSSKQQSLGSGPECEPNL